MPSTIRSMIFGLAAAGVIALAAATSVAADPSQPPNIIIVYTDDMGPSMLGYTGGQAHTPTIDRLASRGIRFTNAHVQSTVCVASRYSLLTGQHAGRCTAPYYLERRPPGTMNRVGNDVPIELDRPNLARALREHGYRTGFVGKSHLVGHEVFRRPERWPEHGLKTYPASADPRDSGITAKMRHNHDWWRRRVKRIGFDFADAVYAANLRELYNEAANTHNVEWKVGAAERFIAESKDRPFFLYLATTVPHGPHPGRVLDGRLPHSLDADPRMTGEGFLKQAPSLMPPRERIKQRALDHGQRLRDAWATWLDAGIASIVNTLREHDLRRNTLILFMSDHGFRRHGKATMHDNGMRVPMFISWPAMIREGFVAEQLVSNVDVAPTLLDLCGVPREASGREMDGHSLRPILEGGDEPVRDDLFGEFGYARSMKTKRWKYIAVRYPPDVRAKIERGETFRGWQGREIPAPYYWYNGHLGHHAQRRNPNYFVKDQLYDLKADPRETRNVAEEHPRVLERMKERLRAHLNTFEDRPFAEFTQP